MCSAMLRGPNRGVITWRRERKDAMTGPRSPMAEFDPPATRCNPTPTITAELATAGFDDAREIGRGGFGAVYRCRQRSLERTVAIKVLTADLDPDNVER